MIKQRIFSQTSGCHLRANVAYHITHARIGECLLPLEYITP